MIKVLVGRELLERIAHDDEGLASLADFEELKRILAQQAEPVPAQDERSGLTELVDGLVTAVDKPLLSLGRWSDVRALARQVRAAQTAPQPEQSDLVEVLEEAASFYRSQMTLCEEDGNEYVAAQWRERLEDISRCRAALSAKRGDA